MRVIRISLCLYTVAPTQAAVARNTNAIMPL